MSETLGPILVDGGSIAGLSAATRVNEHGVPALVLEGRDRLGDRIHKIDAAVPFIQR
ncbi:MAG: FAD-dependent oxidoreductase [Actinomycetota bacterium]|nr:FAD-dependent oxidoreductase [Actinomycetota bacterium]MED5220745.1 FAD-dependent oxidoreductase [Actinomycetota bacterium]MED5232127.1 FAD-dependent oxidoreductase [Actinomycetota bacterium]